MAKMYFRYGAMNCGKTSALLQVAHNYEEQGMKAIVIKSRIDKKGNDTIVSRIGLSRKVDLLLNPKDTIKEKLEFKNLDCILVDEAQFMSKEQIKELWIISKIKEIPVICYGLKTDFRGKLFEGSKAIIELADELEEIVTVCKCGKKARFNARIIDGKYVTEGDVVAIDGLEAKYEPLCGKCYIKKVLNINNII